MESVVALTGMPGSRKSLLGSKFVPLGYQHLVLSEYLGARLRAQQRPLSPDEYWSESISLRRQEGDDVLVRQAWHQLMANEVRQPVVIDALRHPAELQFLLERATCLLLVAVHSAPTTRLARLRDSPNQFYRDSSKLAGLDAHELALGTGTLIAESDYIVFTNTMIGRDLDDFMEREAHRIDEIVCQRSSFCDDAERSARRHHIAALCTLLTAFRRSDTPA